MFHERGPIIVWTLEMALKVTVWSVYWSNAHALYGVLSGDVLRIQKTWENEKKEAQNSHPPYALRATANCGGDALRFQGTETKQRAPPLLLGN